MSLARRLASRAVRRGVGIEKRLRGFPAVQRFPWYDQGWLSSYAATSAYLRAKKPRVSAVFEREMDRLRVDPSFEPVLIDEFFSAGEMSRVRSVIAQVEEERLERHEVAHFGRDVVHNDPFFLDLQRQMVGRVSEIVGEEVEVSYNFLSLYRSVGRCGLHMDAPNAKWTVDVCIDQSRPWDIHFSPVVPWPVDVDGSEDDWERSLRERHTFTPHAMTPGQALIFGGGNQWHHREPMPNATDNDFCTLLFFHFIPAGTKDLVDRARWAERFDLPELRRLLRW